MLKQKIEEPLQEVREWKEEVSLKTRGMTTEEVVRYFREGAEDIWKKHGYKCVPIDNKMCKYVKQNKETSGAF